MNTDTPLPPDEPAGQNPPDGAIINYYLKSLVSEPITLEVLDSAGKLVRRYSSADAHDLPNPATASIPLYWYRPPQALATTPGLHRFLWDMHYQPISGGGGRGGLPIAAIAYNTMPQPNAPWVAPGQYAVKLTVNGQSYTQSFNVKMDPRVKTPPLGLDQQFSLSKSMYDGVLETQTALRQLRAIRAQLKSLRERAGEGALAKELAAFDQKAQELEGSGGGGRGGGGGFMGGGGGGQETITAIGGALNSLMGLLQGADAAPTTQLTAAIAESRRSLSNLMTRWNALKTQDLVNLNAQVKQANLPVVEVSP
jgi:hypothetical protein